jgi:hypothetical protein
MGGRRTAGIGPREKAAKIISLIEVFMGKSVGGGVMNFLPKYPSCLGFGSGRFL